MQDIGRGAAGDDRWAHWLRHARDGGDAQLRAAFSPELLELRDRVLAAAKTGPGDVVLDVGCGTGLVGFGALAQVGETGRVLFTDVSAALLDECRQRAAEQRAGDRCRFLRTGLPQLSEVPDASVDVVTVRSVLIYVTDKVSALTALRRVLRVGGRLGVFEPINRFDWPGPSDRLFGFDITGLEQLGDRVKQAYRGLMPDPDPMLTSTNVTCCPGPSRPVSGRSAWTTGWSSTKAPSLQLATWTCC